MVKPRERNTRYVDAVMTIPQGTLYPMCGMNLAFDRDLIGPAMYFGLQVSCVMRCFFGGGVCVLRVCVQPLIMLPAPLAHTPHLSPPLTKQKNNQKTKTRARASRSGATTTCGRAGAPR